MFIQHGVIRDIVVNADPQKPPYSLLLINKLWPESLNLNIRCYTHSSVKERPTDLDYFENIQVEDSDAVELKVTLVWKNGMFIITLSNTKLSHNDRM